MMDVQRIEDDVQSLVSRVLKVSGLTETQCEIVGQLVEHELPHHRDVVDVIRSVARAARRQHQAKSPAYHVPIDVLTDLQDAGLPALDALDVVEASWMGLQGARTRLTATVDDAQQIDMHCRSLRAIATVLRGLDHSSMLRTPKRLALAIRCTWKWISSWPSEFDVVLRHAGALMDFGFHDREVDTLIGAHRTDEARADVELVIREGHLTKDELLAIVHVGHDIGEGDRRLCYEALVRFRGRVRPRVLLETVRRIGLAHACAFHEITDSTATAIRADETRKRHGLTVEAFLDAYRSFCEACTSSIESFVALAEHWPPNILPSIFAAYPDAKLLLSFAQSGHADTVQRAAVSGVPRVLLERHGMTLLRYLRNRSDEELVVTTEAFALCRGDVETTDRFLALPVLLRGNTSVREMVAREGPSIISDRTLLERVVSVGDAGASFDLALLREFSTFGRWPQRRHFVRVYGLARRFREHGRTPRRAIEEALEVYERLSRRTCLRAASDPAYFRYRMLGKLTPVACVAEIVPSAAMRHAPPVPYVSYVRPVIGAASSGAPDAQGDSESVVDLRTVHTQLDLSDLISERADAETVAALVLYGLCDLGRGVPFAGRHAIPERHILANVRRRFRPDEDALTKAWRWLSSIGVLNSPKKRNGEPVYALNLGSDHANPVGRAVARRTRTLLSRFREQTRR